MIFTFNKVCTLICFPLYFNGVLFDIQRKIYRHGTKHYVKRTLPEPYHHVSSDCREQVVLNFSLSWPRKGAPAHFHLLTFFFLQPRSSLQQQQAVQEGPYFTEAYLHVSNNRFPPAAQVFNYVCIYIYVLNICPNTKAFWMSAITTLFVLS